MNSLYFCAPACLLYQSWDTNILPTLTTLNQTGKIQIYLRNEEKNPTYWKGTNYHFKCSYERERFPVGTKVWIIYIYIYIEREREREREKERSQLLSVNIWLKIMFHITNTWKFIQILYTKIMITCIIQKRNK